MAGHIKGPDWTCVTKDAGWQPRDSQGEIVFDDALWILGGWFDPQIANPRDVWRSGDGESWECVTSEAPWVHSDIPMVMNYNGRLWFMGGRRLPGAENSNSVWSTADGKDWVLETESAPWSARLAAGAVVFQDKMWLIGGTDNFYDTNDETGHNDVWTSTDGKEWTLELENAPWSKRGFHQTVVYDDKIWVLGGGTWKPDHKERNDVWCSADGVNWECVTENADWERRIWFSSFAYRDHLWILGGWNAENGNRPDVWFSKDGNDWTEMKSDVIWNRRHEQSGLVFQDKIWMYGGYQDVLDSEVWTLELPADWSGT
jgi:hypothetical protein